MEDYQRDKILLNLNYMVDQTNDFESVFEGLQAKEMFNDFMVNEIKAKHNEPQRRLRFLYWYVTTRGPKAFSQLCDVLEETNNAVLLDFLTGERHHKEINGENGSNGANYPTLEEEYPNKDEWIVTKAIKRMDKDTKRVYKMSSKMKGLALIINIKNFVNNTSEIRDGSEHDITRLKSILYQLDYVVTVYEDLTAEDIKGKVKEFAAEEDHYKCDSAIVIVMSHGRDDLNSTLSETINIVGYDNVAINSQVIVRQLMAYKCEALRGKPKLFFFQACRGDKFNYPLTGPKAQKDSQLPNNIQTDGQLRPQHEKNRFDSDIIIGYSTSPGYYSLRDPTEGSWYIQMLCRVIAKYAWKEDLVTMLEIVQSECRRENDKHPNWNIHCRQGKRGFNKKFYFQPGFTNFDLLGNRNGS